MTALVGASASRQRHRGSRRVRYGRALLFALTVAFVVTVVGSSGADTATGRLGGDFPAFYSAGSIVGDGDWASLYDVDRQAHEQAALFPAATDEGAYLYFAYPPYVAALYRPLAALDYRLAYALHTVLMLAALVTALALLRPLLSVVDRHFETVCTASLASYPILRAVTGGQNTTLALLLLVGIWRCLHDDREVAAGLLLALLAYKPQYAVPLLGLLVVRGHWRAAAATLGATVVLWSFGAAVMGVGWLLPWWDQVSTFATIDAEVNGTNAVSVLGVAETVLGVGSTASRVVAVPSMLAVAAALAGLWRRSGVVPEATRWAVTLLGLLALAPHAMFYDAGLLCVAAAVVADRATHTSGRWLAAAWTISWTQPLADRMGVAPTALALVAVAGALWSVRTAPVITVALTGSPGRG